MALVAAKASSFFSIKKFSCHFTNSNIKNNLDPTRHQWQTRIFLFMLTQRGTKSVPFQFPMLKLPLRLGPTSSLPLLQKFPMSSLNSDANPDAKTVSSPTPTSPFRFEVSVGRWVFGDDFWVLTSLFVFSIRIGDKRCNFEKWVFGDFLF